MINLKPTSGSLIVSLVLSWTNLAYLTITYIFIFPSLRACGEDGFSVFMGASFVHGLFFLYFRIY